MSDQQKEGQGLIVAGYACGVASLLFFPIGLGLAGIGCGIANITKGRVGHGIAQMVVSGTCAFIGFVLGLAAGLS
jgi:hypothetical protein